LGTFSSSLIIALSICCRVPALDVRPKNDSTNDRSTSSHEERLSNGDQGTCIAVPVISTWQERAEKDRQCRNEQ
jgi:hypothetical protein